MYKIGAGGGCSFIRLVGHGSDARGLEAAKDIAKDETIFILKPAVLGKTKLY